MDLTQLVAYCLGKPGAEETHPWGDGELVAKVGGEAFAFIALESGRVSVTCGRDAAEAAQWRDRYPGAVTTSAYVGRYGWNSVDWTGPVPDDDVRELVDASYDAVVATAEEEPAGHRVTPGRGGRERSCVRREPEGPVGRSAH